MNGKRTINPINFKNETEPKLQNVSGMGNNCLLNALFGALCGENINLYLKNGTFALSNMKADEQQDIIENNLFSNNPVEYKKFNNIINEKKDIYQALREYFYQKKIEDINNNLENINSFKNNDLPLFESIKNMNPAEINDATNNDNLKFINKYDLKTILELFKEDKNYLPICTESINLDSKSGKVIKKEIFYFLAIEHAINDIKNDIRNNRISNDSDILLVNLIKELYDNIASAKRIAGKDNMLEADIVEMFAKLSGKSVAVYKDGTYQLYGVSGMITPNIYKIKKIAYNNRYELKSELYGNQPTTTNLSREDVLPGIHNWSDMLTVEIKNSNSDEFEHIKLGNIRDLIINLKDGDTILIEDNIVLSKIESDTNTLGIFNDKNGFHYQVLLNLQEMVNDDIQKLKNNTIPKIPQYRRRNL